MENWKEIAKKLFPKEYENFNNKFSGRNPHVDLGVTIEQDVKRRDLTYNALFYDLDKREIVDLTGGRADLEAGVTRMVGNAIERFEEDSLRILRAFRFASRYGHPLDPSTAEAIRKRPQLENIDPETGEMKRISQERVWEEFKKAWKQAKDFKQYLSFFDQFNMWEEAFPGISEFCGGHKKVNYYVNSKNFIVVLTHLFHLMSLSESKSELGELEQTMVESWKVEGVTASKVIFLLRLQRLTVENSSEMYKARVRCNIDTETIQEWMRVNAKSNKIFYGLFDAFLNYKPSNFSKKLMEKGWKPGKALGAEIKRLEIEEFKNLLK
jgi:tRNA nucleotidyltransferase/poly(A) polymerase